MIDPFANRLKSGGTVGSMLLEKLVERGGDIAGVDVGARNSMEWPGTLIGQTHYFGFEPNQEEYEKLINHASDAQKLGITCANFGKENYFDSAVWSDTAERPFYVTKGTGACTMMGRTNLAVSCNMWLGTDRQPYEHQHSEVQETSQVKCTTLDEAFKGREYIDFLKIDVEGGEMEVLKGAEKTLAKAQYLMIELNNNTKKYGSSNALVEKYLSQIGFTVLLEHWPDKVFHRT